VVVGQFGPTFEGSFLSDDCDADGYTAVEGNRWLSMIKVSPSGKQPSNNSALFDDEVLRIKLENKLHTRQPNTEKKPGDAYTAVRGVLTSPTKLIPPKPPTKSRTQNIPGNGFGANGSVPAEIIVTATHRIPTKK
jgi:hypothetical protein